MPLKLTLSVSGRIVPLSVMGVPCRPLCMSTTQPVDGFRVDDDRKRPQSM